METQRRRRQTSRDMRARAYKCGEGRLPQAFINLISYLGWAAFYDIVYILHTHTHMNTHTMLNIYYSFCCVQQLFVRARDFFFYSFLNPHTHTRAYACVGYIIMLYFVCRGDAAEKNKGTHIYLFTRARSERLEFQWKIMKQATLEKKNML